MACVEVMDPFALHSFPVFIDILVVSVVVLQENCLRGFRAGHVVLLEQFAGRSLQFVNVDGFGQPLGEVIAF